MTKFPLAHRMGAYSWNYVDLKKIQKVVRVCVHEPEFVDQDECLLYFLKKKKSILLPGPPPGGRREGMA